VRTAITILCLALAGCAGLMPGLPTAPSQMNIQEVIDQKRLDTDFKNCLSYAAIKNPRVSLAKVIEATIKGGASNAAGAALNPAAPALGALGAGVTETLNGLDLLSTNQRNTLIDCLRQKSDDVNPRPYLVLDRPQG
jgi:hypothetical protein